MKTLRRYIHTVETSKAIAATLLLTFAMLACAAFPFTVYAGQIEPIQVRILSEANVKGVNFTLGEVAELDGFNLEQITRVSKIRIGRSPLPGKTRKLSKSYIKTRLNRAIGKNGYRLNMPTALILQRKGQILMAHEIKTNLIQEIHKNYAGYEKANISLTSNVRDVTLPEGKVSFQIQRTSRARLIGGPSSWQVAVFVNGQKAKRLLVRADVEVFGEVVVARGQIRQGELIQAQHLTNVQRNISNQNIGYKPKSDFAVGRQAVRTIHPDEAIKENLTAAPTIIAKGSPVKVVYQTAKLYLTNVAIAQKSGREGDIIPVRTVDSKTTIYAVVKNSKLVEIIM